MACQADRSLTSILTPIVSKLSDMRVVNAELENLVFGPRKEFITMAILVLINIPLVRFINKDWYHTLVATIPRSNGHRCLPCRCVRVLRIRREADAAH